MIQMRLSDLSNILNVKEINSGQTFKGISVNNEIQSPSNLFVAIKGARFDGHDYVKVTDKGAIAAVVEFNPKLSILQLVVSDTLKALAEI